MKNALRQPQTILVLGGGSDIAAAIVTKLASPALRTVVLAGRRPDDIDTTRYGDDATIVTIAFDATNHSTHRDFVAGVVAEHGDLDIVIHAVGQLGVDAADDPVATAALIDVNFAGTASSSLAVAEQLRRQGHGTLIVLSSVAGVRTRASNFVYGSTKAGLDAFTTGLDHSLHGSGAHVMTVRPGFVRTSMTEGMDEAPFTIDVDGVASAVAAGLKRNSSVVWAPAALQGVFGVFALRTRFRLAQARPMTSTSLADAAHRLRSLGVNRVESFGWRDLDDPEGGGSELHADEIFRRWASHGIDIVHRTSVADGAREYERHGYRVIHRGGRFDVFARVIVSQLVRRVRRQRRSDTVTIEIWNGVPWFGPLWAPTRRVVWLHHVHRDMWDDALPRPLNHAGRLLETRFAPLFYRRSQFSTLSESSAEEVRALGIPDQHLAIIPPGVHERFVPDEARRSTTPRVVVVGRLSFVKRQRLALDALAVARRTTPDLVVDVVGDGPDRAGIEAWVDEHDARSWVNVLGRLSDDELLDAYRRAWLVVSTSHAEGWGMSLTEGGACGTPSVATDIAGHRGAAIDGVTGLLVPDDDDLTAAMGATVAELIDAPARRSELGRAAIEHASSLSWTAVATQHLDVICDRLESERSF